jgi:outer membrane protein assembly factor BamB
MQIKAICPRCESTYHVDPGMKGKRMRCPNAICRAIFEVRDAAETPPAAPPVVAPPQPATPPRSGGVGDMVPILSAEAAPPPVPAPPPPPSPLERQPARPHLAAESPPSVMVPSADQQSALDEWFAGSAPVAVAGHVTADGPSFDAWEDAPPVRQDSAALPSFPEANGTFASYASQDLHHEIPARNRSRWILATLVVLVLAMVGGGLWLLQNSGPNDEVQRFTKAETAYKQREYGEANALFRSLANDFPQSDQRQRYQFLAELSAVRDPIHRTQTDKEETLGHLKRLQDFLGVFKTDPLLDEYSPDVADSLYKLVEEMTGFAAKNKDRELLELAKHLNAEASKYKPATLAQAKAIDEGFAQTQKVVAVAEARQELLDRLKRSLGAPTIDAIEQAPDWVRKAGMIDDFEVKSLLDKLPAAHRESIVWSPEAAATAVPSLAGDLPPSLAVVLYRSQKPAAVPDPSVQPVLALVRGVIYALDPRTGLVRWVRRVGIDTTELPAWVPASPAAPPTILVPAAGGSTLLALDASDGSVRWAQVLPQPCAGKPIVIGDRAFVACRDGAIIEIETAGGRRLGRYDLGQTLTHGGVHHPGTNLVYFAADRACVYALDVAARRCAGVLYTGHASGALRCPPALLPIIRGEAVDLSKQVPDRSKLLLCLSDGKRSTNLITYSLPIGDMPLMPFPLGEKLDGRVSFAPLVNSDQLAIVTDAGALAVFGLKQRDNSDADVFPRLRELLPPHQGLNTVEPAQIVFADGQNLWLLAHGRLHHLEVAQSAAKGWQIAPRPLPLAPIGAAVQDAQVRLDDLGTGLYVVTESPDGRACWVTAVDANLQTQRWQRQLGMVGQGQAVAIDGKVLIPDRSGSLLLFEPEKDRMLPGELWKRGGKEAERGLSEQGSFWVLPTTLAGTAIVLAVTNQEARLAKYHDGTLVPLGPAHALGSTVAGNPALVGDTVLVPLANGRLARVSAAGATALDPPWRSSVADKQASGHIVAMAGNRVATTDGSHGLVLWRFDGKELQRLHDTQLKARLVSLTALPSAGGEVRLCVADSARGVTLLEGDMLHKIRSWTLSDNITAGPFVRAGVIFVVIGKRRLVWIDPEKDQPVDGFTFGADIVGQPELVDGVLIVADESGQIQGFDPRKAQKIGLGYRLRADVAPAAAPVPYGMERLFVPLTDGTVLLPSRMWFSGKVLGLPVVR